MKPFHLMPPADLHRLVSALQTGRLSSPYGPVSVGRVCPASDANLLAAELGRLEQAGWTAEQISELAEAVLGTATATTAPVELVWSGPEADGIVNRDTGVVVRELFGRAATEVLVVGFAVYQGREIFARLAERMAEFPTIRVRLFLDVRRPTNGPGAPSVEDPVKRFANEFLAHEWPGPIAPDLYYDPRSLTAESSGRSSLHAKCVIIDRTFSLVTSANFTEAAQMRNIEVGALIQSPAFSAQLAGHFDKLVEAGVLKPISTNGCRGT